MKDDVCFYLSHSCSELKGMLPSEIRRWYKGQKVYGDRIRKQASRFNGEDELAKYEKTND